MCYEVLLTDSNFFSKNQMAGLPLCGQLLNIQFPFADRLIVISQAVD